MMAGQTTTLATPVSSSMVANTTPAALPGRWRTSTTPATDTRAPSRRWVASAQLRMPSRARAARRKRSGCAFSDNPAVW